MRLGTLLVGRVLVLAVSSAGAAPLRPFQVRDSVTLSYFGTLARSAPADLDDDGLLSPDGRHFVKVTHRGVLPQGVSEGTIWIFDTEAVRRCVNHPNLPLPKPSALVRMSVTANSGTGLVVLDDGNAITDLKWSDDGRSLTFLGRDGHPNRQIYRVDIDTHAITALTPANQDVLDYARSGARFVYLTGPDADRQAVQAWVSAGPGIPDISVGTSTSLMPLLYPHFRGNAYSEPLHVQLWQVEAGHPEPVTDPRTGAPIALVTRYTSLLVSLSHDGTQALTIAEPEDARQVSPKLSAPSLAYQVIDLRSGRITGIEGVRFAPGEPGLYRAAWAPDGQEIALGSVSLPGRAGSPTGATPCGIAVVGLSVPGAQCIADARGRRYVLLRLQWSSDGRRIQARYRVEPSGYDGAPVRALHGVEAAGYRYLGFEHHDSRWRERTLAPKAAGAPILLSVHEALNNRPVLVATDSRTGKSRPIFDPNPQLADIDLGSVSIFRWKDPHGRDDIGGLALPPGFVRGRRYPLVIQTHGFDPRKFFRVGYSDTSNAGRALAGRGLIVLQVREPEPDRVQNWHDSIEFGMDVYLSAIDQLAAEGLIDPARVGISGYSYSAWLVATSLTQAPNRFAAAELANSDPVTLTGWDEWAGTPGAFGEALAYVGARPFGKGLKLWMERSPSFQTDKITAPMLFQPTDPWHLLSMYDMYAALLEEGKPVELQYIRGGEHNVRKPLEVLAHEEMIVDWFDFWLNGHEDPDPGKAAQYARWRKLRGSRKVSRPQTG